MKEKLQKWKGDSLGLEFWGVLGKLQLVGEDPIPKLNKLSSRREKHQAAIWAGILFYFQLSCMISESSWKLIFRGESGRVLGDEKKNNHQPLQFE